MSQPERLDGRRVRREQNVEAVVEAMLDLLGEGELNPAAAMVAERSGVSLRSVFRYFDDMDSLTELAIARQMERAARHFDLIEATGDVEERATSLARRRLEQHAHLAPYARAAMVRAHQYPAVAQGLAARRDALRRQVEALFAPELDALDDRTRDDVLAALEAVTSIEVVETMVSHRGLSAPRVEATLRRSVLGVLSGA
jgi:AcrR family transcriptional regulator